MNKGQIILVVIAVLAVVGLYNLPKVVVDNDNDNDPQSFVDESSPNGVVDHSSEIPEEAAPRIDYWKSELNIGDNLKENDSALDSLMKVYMEINKYDSAAYFAELYAEKFNTVEHWQKAGDAYFEAFSFALEEQKVRSMGTKARAAYDKVLAAQPDNFDVQHNVAMIYISGSNPMQGIMMLREILEKDPDNRQALMSMGRMSIQTGQFENGASRFESLLSYYPEDVEGNFFLGVCYFESGQLVKAKAQFEKVKTLGAGEQVITAADEYLERIQ
tara:strand:+ start:1021 stop:1839 length:819 start_codon:yes stop_codon:yes gene_type:complete